MLLGWLIVLGLVIGSFLNVLVLRLRAGQAITGRSRCPQCFKQLAWYYNIPLASFVYLRGHCAFCHKSISWQYPLVELATATGFALGNLVYWRGGLAELITYLILVTAAVALFVYDYKYMQLPDIITLPAIVLVAVLGWWRGMEMLNIFVAAAITAGFFAVQFLISLGRWVGAGDMRLGALTGLSLGWPLCLVALVLAYVSGAIVGLILILFKKKTFKSQIPFGVFLTTTTVVAFLWGEQILDWYWRLFI